MQINIKQKFFEDFLPEDLRKVFKNNKKYANKHQ